MPDGRDGRRPSLLPVAGLLLGAAALSSCASAQFSGQRAPWLAVYERVRAEMRPLSPLTDAGGVPESGPAGAGGLSEYYAYYGFGRIRASGGAFGFLEAGDGRGRPLRIAAHRFDPERPRGSVLLLHGYFDHAGNLVDLASRLVAAGWTVLLYDLPGHGFSDGARGDIGDFSAYAAAVAAGAAYLESSCASPRYAIGHSAGGAALLEYALEGGSSFSGFVLFAPLVRVRGWAWIRLAEPLVRPFGYRRVRQPSVCRNEEYNRELERDWMGLTEVEPGWLRALFRWESRFERAPLIGGRWLVFQGDGDATVDWRWNVPALLRRAPGARAVMLPGGSHLLPNELDQAGAPVMDEVLAFLAGA